MLYEKVVLEAEEARRLYREDLILSEDNRIVFRKRRRFQEFLGASTYEDGCKTISKGPAVKFALELPAYVPVREPLENWFQVAMRQTVKFEDPLGLKARYKGFLPARLILDGNSFPLQERTGTIMIEDDQDFEFTDYALFIYDRADYDSFIEEVQRLLGRFLHYQRMAIARDRSGNTIMASDSLTDQAMMLMPLAFIPGGKEYMSQKWREVIET